MRPSPGSSSEKCPNCGAPVASLAPGAVGRCGYCHSEIIGKKPEVNPAALAAIERELVQVRAGIKDTEDLIALKQKELLRPLSDYEKMVAPTIKPVASRPLDIPAFVYVLTVVFALLLGRWMYSSLRNSIVNDLRENLFVGLFYIALYLSGVLMSSCLFLFFAGAFSVVVAPKSANPRREAAAETNAITSTENEQKTEVVSEIATANLVRQEAREIKGQSDLDTHAEIKKLEGKLAAARKRETELLEQKLMAG